MKGYVTTLVYSFLVSLVWNHPLPPGTFEDSQTVLLRSHINKTVLDLKLAIQKYQMTQNCGDYIDIVDKAVALQVVLCRLNNKPICMITKKLKIHLMKMFCTKLNSCTHKDTLEKNLLPFRSSIGK